jgi:hypothetical protein
MENKSEEDVAAKELVRNSNPVKRTRVPDLNDEDIEEDYESLEYEEDCYYSYVAESGTPSFDHCWPEDGNFVENLPVSGLDDSLAAEVDPFCVEAEFYSKPASKKARSVRVTFQDLSKPYFAKVSSPRNYRRFLQLVKGKTLHIIYRCIRVILSLSVFNLTFKTERGTIYTLHKTEIEVRTELSVLHFCFRL